MNRLKTTGAMFGLLTACLTPSVQAGEWNKETQITISAPVQVRDTVLPPGKYVLKLVAPDSSQNVVGIFNADGTRLQGMIMGWPAYRADADDQKLVTVSQPEGNQPAMLK